MVFIWWMFITLLCITLFYVLCFRLSIQYFFQCRADSHIYFFSPPSKIEQQDQVLARQINTFKRKVCSVCHIILKTYDSSLSFILLFVGNFQVRGVQKENKSLQDGFVSKVSCLSSIFLITEDIKQRIKTFENNEILVFIQIINAKEEDPHYEYELVDNGEHCDSDFGFQNEGPGIFALRLQPN